MADTGPVEAPVVTKIGEPAGNTSRRSKPRRSLQRRLFSVGVFQVIGLIAASVLLGLFLLALDLDPNSDSLNLRGAVWGVIQALFQSVLWLVGTLWRPFLAGAAVVIPAFLLWRLASLPFRN
ncbi:MAG TPA: hypothetical protein EYG02_03850 [Henriciella marina]|uniref:DUF6460 domain-containing protein n=1 Tax=Henriciella sp. TaxID=1968823 RepID=UPI0017F92E43|nr:hypothetical protein [Henriciella sp.]HIG21601.1 hypothetical protein [Henriciella sp.]HIK64147.1 hypothetical protein [Henriciella marina]